MPANTNDYKNLLQVFRDGLICGAITKQEITAWTDAIINKEEEPDYFFIEISLSKNADELISVIGNLNTVQTALTIRALFGLLYHKLTNSEITFGSAIIIVNGLNNHILLPLTERCEIYQLEEYLEEYNDWPVNEAMVTDVHREDVLAFLKRYSAFRLENYQEWENINQGIAEEFAQEEAEEQARYEAAQREYQLVNRKTIIITKTKKHVSLALFCVLAVVPFLFVFYIAVKYQAYISENQLWPAVTILEVLILIRTTTAIISKSNRS